MVKKVLIVFAVLALMTANAATFKVKLFQPSVVQGQELKPGEYKLDWNESKLTIVSGKTSVKTDVKVETGDQKFSSTTVRYANTDGKYSIREIRLGGTKTTLVLNP
jgi:hypothetical protein